MQDFYLELTEDNRKITPRDYLELALSPVVGRDRDVVDKNKVTCFFLSKVIFIIGYFVNYIFTNL